MSPFVCFSLVFVLSGLRFRGNASDLYSGGLSLDFSGGGEIFIGDGRKGLEREAMAGDRTGEILDNISLAVNDETGRARKGFKVVIPMLLMLKLTAMMVITLVVIKFLLLVAALATNVSLLMSGFVLAKHLVYYGMTALAKHFFIPHGFDHGYYKDTGLDLSGYGYNSYNNEHLIPNYVKPEYSSSTQTSSQYFLSNSHS